jgi:hypothetical protein
MMEHSVDGGLGVTLGGPGVPREILAVLVDAQYALGSKFGQQEVDNTVAHELAHCCNVKHHGDNNYPPGEVWWQEAGSGKWRLSGYDFKSVVAAQHRQHSGVEGCIMRYYRASFYEYAQGTFRWRENTKAPWTYGLRYPPSQVPGNFFCLTPGGTGINDPKYQPSPCAPPRAPCPVAGDADVDRGNCAGQFCVNDLKH